MRLRCNAVMGGMSDMNLHFCHASIECSYKRRRGVVSQIFLLVISRRDDWILGGISLLVEGAIEELRHRDELAAQAIYMMQ